MRERGGREGEPISIAINMDRLRGRSVSTMNSLKGFGRGLKEKMRRRSDASGISSASDSNASTPSTSPGISSQLDNGFGKTTSIGK